MNTHHNVGMMIHAFGPPDYIWYVQEDEERADRMITESHAQRFPTFISENAD